MPHVFDPSQRQLDALHAMARMLGLNEPQSVFADRAAFQAYWDRLQQRCDQRRAAGPSAAAPRKRQSHKVFNNQSDLRDWATNYLLRYQPSHARLHLQLKRRSANPAHIEAVLTELTAKRDERAVAFALAGRLQRQGKNLLTIRKCLLTKQFDRDLVSAAMAAITPADDVSLLDPDRTRRQVQRLLNQGRAPNQIRQRLIERPADRAVIDQALADLTGADDPSPEQVALQRALERERRRTDDPQVIIRRLANRGFAYGAIRAALDQNDDAT